MTTRRTGRTLARSALHALVLAAAITSCRRSNAPDAGGDSALARDLAIVQMQTNMARDSVARAGRAAADSSLAPAESVPPSVAPPAAPTDSTAMVTVAQPESAATTAPAATAATTAPTSAASSVARRAPADPCTSPSSASQRACLRVRLATYDARLNHVYGRYIARLRSAPASRGGGAPALRKLRESERAWVKYRDAMCARKLAGKEGKLWAPARAECLGKYATERAQLLERMLAGH